MKTITLGLTLAILIQQVSSKDRQRAPDPRASITSAVAPQTAPQAQNPALFRKSDLTQVAAQAAASAPALHLSRVAARPPSRTMSAPTAVIDEVDQESINLLEVVTDTLKTYAIRPEDTILPHELAEIRREIETRKRFYRAAINPDLQFILPKVSDILYQTKLLNVIMVKNNENHHMKQWVIDCCEESTVRYLMEAINTASTFIDQLIELSTQEQYKDIIFVNNALDIYQEGINILFTRLGEYENNGRDRALQNIQSAGKQIRIKLGIVLAYIKREFTKIDQHELSTQDTHNLIELPRKVYESLKSIFDIVSPLITSMGAQQPGSQFAPSMLNHWIEKVVIPNAKSLPQISINTKDPNRAKVLIRDYLTGLSWSPSEFSSEEEEEAEIAALSDIVIHGIQAYKDIMYTRTGPIPLPHVRAISPNIAVTVGRMADSIQAADQKKHSEHDSRPAYTKQAQFAYRTMVYPDHNPAQIIPEADPGRPQRGQSMANVFRVRASASKVHRLIGLDDALGIFMVMNRTSPQASDLRPDPRDSYRNSFWAEITASPPTGPALP
ncbi:MAG: hypothetical protein LBL32_02080 [Holosporales bacterium]|jgi:hypothetical protein|nr:hypothetical protein [Holosporales bacterium]